MKIKPKHIIFAAYNLACFYGINWAAHHFLPKWVDMIVGFPLSMLAIYWGMIFFSRKFMNARCFLFGHKPAPYTDSGYAICERCGMHSFYDNPHCCHEAKWPYYDSDAVLLRPYFYARQKIAFAMARHTERNKPRTCHYCFKSSKQKHWTGDTCPKCKEQNLPF